MNEDPLDEQPTYPLTHSAACAGGTLVTMGLLDVLAHLGPTGLLVGGLLSYVAWKHGPELCDYVREKLPPAPTSADEQEEPTASQPPRRERRSVLDRALGRYPETDEEAEGQTGEQAAASPKETAHEGRERWNERWDANEQERDEIVLPRSSSLFPFSQLLESGFTPSLHRIFLGQLPNGTAIVVEAKDLCHIALAGVTGGGKSSLMRLVMAQLCAIGVPVLLLNPHYMRYDHSGGEDWTPFEPYLEKPPIECAHSININLYLQWMAETLLPRRIERGRDGKAIGKPFFIVIDELPAIAGEIKEAPGYIAKILREGRKYGIYLIVASTDFLVKTTGMESGGVRKCFRTACYVGGDVTTANALLNETGEKIPENRLGKGTMMLRCAATKQAVLTTVPFVDNASLYRLLGPSTYQSTRERGAKQDDEGLFPPQGRIPIAQQAVNGPHSPIPHSLTPAFSVSYERGRIRENAPLVKEENAVNGPEKRVNAGENAGEYSLANVNGSPAFTQAEELQVLLAYSDLLKAGIPVTRTGIRDVLKWDNKQYTRIIKPVCDKHHIG